MILYDWITVTCKDPRPSILKSLFGLDEIKVWETGHGFHGYLIRDYCEGISLHHQGFKEDMGTCIEVSGKGCRMFEEIGHGNYNLIFKEILENPEYYNITRLDIAFDDHEGIFDINEICKDTMAQNYISKFQKYKIEFGTDGICIYHGSKSSEVLIRIYDKAKEQKKNTSEHWIRFELQLRGKRALEFINNQMDLGDKFLGVINNYLRYVKHDELDSNKRRWLSADYWIEFINSAHKIKLFTTLGMEYTYDNLEHYVMKQAGNSIDTLIRIIGIDKFLEHLKVRGTILNIKQQQLIRKYQNETKRLDKDVRDIVQAEAGQA